VFWYGCPTCFNLEPHISRWLETERDDVVFTRIAGSMAPSWRVHARAFYTAEHLGVTGRVHGRIYDAFHLQRQALNTVDAVAAIFVEHGGVERDAFMSAFNSFTVDARMRRGDQRTRNYRLTAVPAIVVNGRYRTDPGRAQGLENMMRVVDHLIQLERRERAATPEVR
jgi:thiol:disulfide interchange protein DsbA